VLVEVFSDVVCPWCAVGKRRLEAALARFEHGDEVEVGELSFTWYRDESAAPVAALPGTPRRRRSGSGRRGAS